MAGLKMTPMQRTANAMTLDDIVAELLRQRQWLDNAILCLSKVQKSRKRRGRPPKWLTDAREHGLLEMTNPNHEPAQTSRSKPWRSRTNGALGTE